MRTEGFWETKTGKEIEPLLALFEVSVPEGVGKLISRFEDTKVLRSIQVKSRALGFHGKPGARNAAFVSVRTSIDPMMDDDLCLIDSPMNVSYYAMIDRPLNVSILQNLKFKF